MKATLFSSSISANLGNSGEATAIYYSSTEVCDKNAHVVNVDARQDIMLNLTHTHMG